MFNFAEQRKAIGNDLHPLERITTTTDNMNAPLTLSEKQRAALTEVYEQYLDAVQALAKQDDEQLMLLREEKNERLKQLLNADQYQSFLATQGYSDQNSSKAST